MKRTLLFILGFITLGIGAAGVFLPVLPTTPFVICAAGCFSVSSPTIYNKLRRSPFFGDYINGIKNREVIGTKARVQGIIVLWVMLIISAVIIKSLTVRIILAVVGICVTIHLLTIRRK
ncbi:MAG: YbaN family protein [Clostridiales Family XIII bacterium]|jgi:uncharacterized membrane protein YbaN (DUF454 family)|nr:YbaN family protein [Clostridiales Family XIII bacterium]